MFNLWGKIAETFLMPRHHDGHDAQISDGHPTSQKDVCFLFIKSLSHLMWFLFVLYFFHYWNPPDAVLQAWPCLSCCRRVFKPSPGLEVPSGHRKCVTSLVISVRFCLNSPLSYLEREGTNVALSVHLGISSQLCIQQHHEEALIWPWG